MCTCFVQVSILSVTIKSVFKATSDFTLWVFIRSVLIPSQTEDEFLDISHKNSRWTSYQFRSDKEVLQNKCCIIWFLVCFVVKDTGLYCSIPNICIKLEGNLRYGGVL